MSKVQNVLGELDDLEILFLECLYACPAVSYFLTLRLQPCLDIFHKPFLCFCFGENVAAGKLKYKINKVVLYIHFVILIICK